MRVSATVVQDATNSSQTRRIICNFSTSNHCMSRQTSETDMRCQKIVSHKVAASNLNSKRIYSVSRKKRARKNLDITTCTCTKWNKILHTHTQCDIYLGHQCKILYKPIVLLKRFSFFTALCYIAMERYCRRMTSVCASVCLWRWWIVITYVKLGGILLHS